MITRKKSSINIINSELHGQMSFFGKDLIDFKCVSLVNPQKYFNLCNKFKLKIIVRKKIMSLPFMNIN